MFSSRSLSIFHLVSLTKESPDPIVWDELKSYNALSMGKYRLKSSFYHENPLKY